MRLRLTPYTDTIGSGRAKLIEGSEGYWGKFPDVFDPSFADGLRRSMEGKRGKSAGDPWCIGYFSDNEMSWGDDVSLALAALKSAAGASRQAGLRRRPQGQIRRHRETEPGLGHPARLLGCAARKAARRRTDPRPGRTWPPSTPTPPSSISAPCARPSRPSRRNQLYLGCRFAWVNARAAAAAAKYCDVVSYNLYQRSVADFKFNGGADVPLIIGEFHFGALDRGMFHTGLVPVANQQARAEAYKEYVLRRAAPPAVRRLPLVPVLRRADHRPRVG